MLEWKENISCQEWDNHVTNMKGHPLQSATWGNSRKLTDGMQDMRWIAFQDGAPIYMARIEVRYFLKVIKIAWVPRGPIDIAHSKMSVPHKEFLQRLKSRGFFLCCTAPWVRSEPRKKNENRGFNNMG